MVMHMNQGEGGIMNNIYTCPYCGRRYKVNKEGNYICDCGVHFNYPEILSNSSYNFANEVFYSDSSSRSVKRNSVLCLYSEKKMGFIAKKDCELGKISLIFAVLGLIFFGFLTVPALAMGILTVILMHVKGDYRENNFAPVAILVSIVGIFLWGAIYFSYM